MLPGTLSKPMLCRVLDLGHSAKLAHIHPSSRTPTHTDATPHTLTRRRTAHPATTPCPRPADRATLPAAHAPGWPYPRGATPPPSHHRKATPSAVRPSPGDPTAVRPSPGDPAAVRPSPSNPAAVHPLADGPRRRPPLAERPRRRPFLAERPRRRPSPARQRPLSPRRASQSSEPPPTLPAPPHLQYRRVSLASHQASLPSSVPDLGSCSRSLWRSVRHACCYISCYI